MLPITSYWDDGDRYNGIINRFEYRRWKERAVKKASQNGLCLKYKPEFWHCERNILLAAIRQNPLAIRYSRIAQDDKFIALLAVILNSVSFHWLSPTLQNDADIRAADKRHLVREETFQIEGSCEKIFLTDWPECSEIANLSSIVDPAVEICFLKLESDYHSHFLRDSHLLLFDDKHLIPYPIQNTEISDEIRPYLPGSADYFIFNVRMEKKEGVIGKGFKMWNVTQALIHCYDYQIPFKRATTCIEGGNCFLFMHKDKRKGIVGEISLYLTLIALEEQGFFQSLRVENDLLPSEDSFRVARNLEIVRKKKEGSMPFDSEIDYLEALMEPVPIEEKNRRLKEAQIIEVKVELSKECIAKELDLFLDDLVFIPQTQFHIDMEMFVIPGGTVVLHDDNVCLEFLSELLAISELNEEEKELVKLYIKRSVEKLHTFKSIRNKRIKILKEQGFPIRLFPGVFEAPAKSSLLNYCNGLFVKKEHLISYVLDEEVNCEESSFTFVTNGPSHKSEVALHQKFLDYFHFCFPDLEIKIIPKMSHFISDYQGGVHCLTFETHRI